MVDSAGHVYVFVGNGYGCCGYDGAKNFSESVLKLDPANALKLLNWFTPDNWNTLDMNDQDISSSGPLLIPGTNPPLIAGGGKAGYLYVLDTTDLGKFNSTDSQIVQEEYIAVSGFRGGPVYWQRSAANGGPLLYNWGVGDFVKAYAFSGAQFAATPASEGSVSPVWPGGILTLSANGAAHGSGVLWATVATITGAQNDPPDVYKRQPYTIANASTLLVSDPTGFASTSGLNFVGGATLSNNALQLSAVGGANNATAVWFATPVNIQTFTTDFYFSIQEVAHIADGFTFTLQNASAGLNAVGGINGGLGYQGITSSVAVKFDLFDNAGEGNDSTGFYTNGAAPTMPAVDMTTSPVNLLGPDILDAHITYDGTTLTLTLIDTVSGGSFTTSSALNIPAIVGSNTAYAGFTAGPGATQNILNWTYTGSPATMAATPTFTPGPGSYTGTQSVTINDGTSGAVIHYTADGSVPTTASPVYSSSSPIMVGNDQTLKAIAVASGYATSAVGAAVYTITPRTASPSFAPVAGTYSTPQSVTITDTTPNAVIHYTTSGCLLYTSRCV